MVSSLAAQLAQGASLNASLLVDKSRRKPGESYLFTGKEADQHDLESIYALGVNGLLQLKSIDPSLGDHENTLFSDSAKSIDRTLQATDANVELDRHIAALLQALGPHLMDAPTGKVLEWLVRRFRIHEFNVDDVLALFLPYHESPHFAKMLTILHLKKESTWGYLIPFKSAARAVPRIALVNEMLRNIDLARFVAALLPAATKQGCSHRTLLVFNAATLHDFIGCSKSLDESTVAYILPALVQPLQTNELNSPSKDAVLGSYVLLSALSQKCHFAPAALKVIVGAMASCAHNVSTKQFVSALVSVCEPQDQLEGLSDTASSAILHLPSIHNELRKAVAWQGAEKVIMPLLPRLVMSVDDPTSLSILESIIASTDMPPSVVERTSVLLMSSPVPDHSETRQRLLSSIHQRHPEALQKAANGAADQDDAVKQLMVSLSVVVPGVGKKNKKTGPESDKIVASMSSNKSVRATAVQDLLQTLTDQNDLDPANVDSIHSALLMRVADTSAKVVEALYGNPTVLAPIVAKYPDAYVQAVTTTLSNPKVKEPLILAHIAFLANHFAPAANTSASNAVVFEKAFFPFLLLSEPRKDVSIKVWEILGSKKAEKGKGFAEYELLGGCVDTWRWESSKDSLNAKPAGETKGESKERKVLASLPAVNVAISAKIAENILASNNYKSHFESLLLQLQDRRAHVRGLAYLVTRSLLGQLSGEQQVEAAFKILRAMNLQTLDGIDDFMNTSDNFEEFLDDVKLSRNLVTNPAAPRTTHWLQMSILVLFPIVSRPSGILLNWFIDAETDYIEETTLVDTRATQYVLFMRAVYRLANSSSSATLLSTRLLQAQFIGLKDDTLSFLAGIWTCSASDGNDGWITRVALRHAIAFFAAHQTEEKPADFQTVLPSLLIAMHSSNAATREAAAECVHVISQISQQKRPASVYGYDTVYGKGSEKLQYLDWGDFVKYAGTLDGYSSHIVNDHNYTKVFHREHLQRTAGDSKKDSAYKQSVICYLLSHVNAIQLPFAKITLLEMLDGISREVKVQMMLPTIEQLVLDPDSGGVFKTFGAHFEKFSALTLSLFDASAAKDLNKPDSVAWPVFLKSIRHYLTPESLPGPRLALTHAIAHGLFMRLTFERKAQICEAILSIGTSELGSYLYCKSLLGEILTEAPMMIHLLSSVQPRPLDINGPASKRAKLDKSDPLEDRRDSLASLALLSDVLSSATLPGSLDLVSCFMETLNKVVHYELPAQTDISYIEQLLMSAIENAASKIAVAPNLSPSAIRLDILVELIRVADNPQTFHQALLLVASLSRLAPESVLHNIMPVFTFMGSNVFHRDDSYSFRVVQKTIDSIVPVMVSSLKQEKTDKLELYIGSRDFLRIFTDAANHIPRHRRTNFFAHLVDVMGPDEFLAPICMLLVDKAGNRVIRQNVDDAQAALALPLSLLQHYSPAIQIPVLTELLRECKRMIAHAVDHANAEPTFLEAPSSDEESASLFNSISKRRALALMIFVGYALKLGQSSYKTRVMPDDGALKTLVSLITDISTTPSVDSNLDDLYKVAHSSSGQALNVMPAVDFIHAILAMLESGEHRIQAGALNIFTARLPLITDKTRRAITPIIVRIVDSIRKVLSASPEVSLATAAFNALKVVGATICPGEESSVTNTVPLVLAAIRDRKMAVPAITVLSPFVTQLGPRIIPFFREIVENCVGLSRDVFAGKLQEHTLVEDALAVLQNLLASIPTFWGTVEITQLVKLLIEIPQAWNTHSSAMAALMKATAKKAPTKVLLPAMYEMWPSVAIGHAKVPTGYAGYFRLLKRSLHAASRPTVLEHIRPLFKVFVEAFDVRSNSSAETEAEPEAIGAFMELVVKLNDTAFRPLFRRLYDWAFANDLGQANARKVTFCHVYGALLEYFKALMTPYMSFLLQPFVDILQSFANSSEDDTRLWLCVIQTLTKTLEVDEAAFWRDDKLRLIGTEVVKQVAVCIRLNIADGKPALSECLVSLVEVAASDSLLKAINLDLLMHTRSDDARLRLFALSCSAQLWRTHGAKLLGFVSETTTFIAECAEDDNDSVVRESHKLKDAVESVAGSITGL
ncbi:hypothetical protein PLICRDRAFT_686024 [Plicaturopsis crispa FD-325 SS-3]|nr:hypothetical protein PLICRDRAFT_686024 [Plicaturopsis crispa FD-325 SS-3]